MFVVGAPVCYREVGVVGNFGKNVTLGQLRNSDYILLNWYSCKKKGELCFRPNWAQKLTFGPYIMYI